MRINKLNILFIIFYLSALVVNASNANTLLSEVSSRLNSAKSLQIHFAMSAQGHSTKGQMIVSGNKFYVETPEIAAWHNGNLQWVMNKSDNEVNLSKPDASELQQLNPLLIISSLKNNYNATEVKSAVSSSSVIKLTPKTKATDISSATLTINNSTKLPSSVSLKLTNGQNITINISSLKIGNSVNSNVFNFDKKKYPKAQIIDLR